MIQFSLANKNRQKLKTFFSFLAFALLFSFSAVAQNYSKAVISDTGVITFDKDTPLSGMYAFDFSDKNYSENQAKSIAKNLKEKSIHLHTQVEFSQKKIIIFFDQTDPKIMNWNIEDWNKHLTKIQSK